MTIVDPIPVEAPYGAADWKDYKHNWREVDTDWIQDRSILRFATAAQRDSKLTTPQVGQFIYNNTTDLLEFRSKTNVWKSYKPAPLNMDTVTDTTTLVKISQVGAGSKGMSFSTTNISTDMPVTLNGGTLTADATGVSIKTGTKTAKLTTDTDWLISDTPLRVPSIEFSGTGTVITAPGKTISAGTLSAGSISSTGTISASGAITGANESTLGGVNHRDGYTLATNGYVSQAGLFHGDASSALMKFRNASTGVVGTAYFAANITDLVLTGGVADFNSTPRVMGDRSIQFHGAAGLLGYAGPVVYTATALSAASYPNGTIWVQP